MIEDDSLPTSLHVSAEPPREVLDTATMSSESTPDTDIEVDGLIHIPGFSDLTEVGRGGMGVVYRAHELAMNRIVALKLILNERSNSDEELIRFRLEAEFAARVRHPNVVQVFESGIVGRQPYLVMEWIDGGTLAAHMDALGLVNERFTVAHGVWLDADDMKRLGDRGSSVAHNPGSSMRLGNGLADQIKVVRV